MCPIKVHSLKSNSHSSIVLEVEDFQRILGLADFMGMESKWWQQWLLCKYRKMEDLRLTHSFWLSATDVLTRSQAVTVTMFLSFPTSKTMRQIYFCTLQISQLHVFCCCNRKLSKTASHTCLLVHPFVALSTSCPSFWFDPCCTKHFWIVCHRVWRLCHSLLFKI